MKKIGLIGEDPNDTSSISNLLNQEFSDKVNFVHLVRRIRGSQLDTLKFHKQVEFEFEDNKCDFVIAIRDLDGFESENEKLKKHYLWFDKINSSVNNNGIILINIWELEALIYADIEVFNKLYDTKLTLKGDPSFIKDPKDELKRKTRKGKNVFHENHCPEIFKKLRFEEVLKNSKSFKSFIEEFTTKLKVA
jgi:hypothetical protein